MKLAPILGFLCVSSIVAAVGCASPVDAEDAESVESDIVKSCRAAETASRADARSTTRVASVISDVLGAKIACTASDAHRIVVSASDAYFGSAVRCDVGRVAKLDPASFTAAMEKRGFYGWDLVDGVVLGEWTSRPYRACEPLPRGEDACRGDVLDTARLEGLITASLGARARCSAATPRTISASGDHYYAANVTCTVPSTSAAASYDARMKSFGWNGFRLTGNTIEGVQTSRLCASYGSPAASAP
jgi:hypothetical protein